MADSNRQSRDSSIRSSDGAADSSSIRGDYTTELQRRYEEVLRERDTAELANIKTRADFEDALKRAETLKQERDRAVNELNSISRTGTGQPDVIDDRDFELNSRNTQSGGVQTGMDSLSRPSDPLNNEDEIGIKQMNGGLTWASGNRDRNGNSNTSRILQTHIDATAGKITWETHVVNLTRTLTHGIGIAISGGRDNPMSPEYGDYAVYISDVIKGGPSEGKIMIGDRVLSVNGVSFKNIEHATAVLTLREGGSTVNIVVQRKVVVPAKVDLEQPFKVTLTKKKKKEDFGISFSSRLSVKSIRPGSLAALQGDLKEGDYIIRINNIPADSLSITEVRKIFEKSSKDKISLIVSRCERSTYPTPASSSAVPSSHHSTEDVRAENNGSDQRLNATQQSQNYSEQLNGCESKLINSNQNSLARPLQSNPQQFRDVQHYPPQYLPNGSLQHEHPDSMRENTINGYANEYPGVGTKPDSWHDSVYNVRAFPSNGLGSYNTKSNAFPYDARDTMDDASLPPPSRSFGYHEPENKGISYGIQEPDYPKVQLRSESTPKDYDARGLRPTSEVITGPELGRSLNARPNDWTIERSNSGFLKPSPEVDNMESFRGQIPEQDYVSRRPRPLNEDVIPYRRPPAPDREPRIITFRKEGGVGIRISGGNRTGIFVAKVAPNTPAEMQGLCEGDLILKINDTETRGMTREEAVLRLLGLRDHVTLVVQYCRPEYERLMAEGGTGDLFHIRTHFTYSVTEHGEMAFQKGDIFQVTDTLYSGVVGSWQASLLRGQKSAKKGIIPNRNRAEQLSLAQGSSNKENLINPLNSRNTGRSNSGFFKRKTASRAKSLGKDNWDDLILGTRSTKFSAYERVVLREPGFIRPVVIFGPLADVARQKLVQDLPEWFEFSQADGKSDGDKSIRPGVIKLSAIRHIIDKRKHAVLDVTPSAVDRLNYAQYAPIVIYLRAESKQSVKELRHHWARHSSKSYRKLFEQSEVLENTFKHLFSCTIPLTNGESWYRKLKDAIDKAQKERLWMSEFQPTEAVRDDILFPLNHRLSFISSLESDVDGFHGGYVGGDFDPGTPLLGTPVRRTPQQRGYYDITLAADPHHSRGLGGSLGWERRGRLMRSSSDPSIATLDNMPNQPQPSAYEQHIIVPVQNGSSDAFDFYRPLKTTQSEDFTQHSNARQQSNMVVIGREPQGREPPSIGRVQSEYVQRRSGLPMYRSNAEPPQYRSNIDPYATLTPSERQRFQQQAATGIRYDIRQHNNEYPGSGSTPDSYQDGSPFLPPQYSQTNIALYDPERDRPYPGPSGTRIPIMMEQGRSVPNLQQSARVDAFQQPIRMENGEVTMNDGIYERNGHVPRRERGQERENQYPTPYQADHNDQRRMMIEQDDSRKFNSLRTTGPHSGLPSSGQFDDPRAESRRGASQYAPVSYYSSNDVRGNTIHQSIRNTYRPKTAEYGSGVYFDATLRNEEQMSRSQMNVGPSGRYNSGNCEYIGLRAKSETHLAGHPETQSGGRDEREPSCNARANYLYDRPYIPVFQSSENINKNGSTGHAPSLAGRFNVPPPKPPHLPGVQSNGLPGQKSILSKSNSVSETPSKASEMSSEPDERRSSAFETYRKFFESNASQNKDDQKSQNKGNENINLEDNQTVVATARGVFDCNGGVLESKETGVSVIVPKGAIPENVRQEIYFKVCKDGSIVPPLDEQKGETLLSPLVMCGPHGLKFLKPIELRLPHSASINPESWSFALKSSDSPVGHPTNWHNMSLADSDGITQGKVSKNSVSVMVDHF